MSCGAEMVTNNCPSIVNSLALMGNFLVLTLDLSCPYTQDRWQVTPAKWLVGGLMARCGSLGWGCPEHLKFIYGHNEQGASEWLFSQLHSAPCLQKPCHDQAAEGSSEFSLNVVFVSIFWSMFIFSMRFMLRVRKKHHSLPSLSALYLLLDEFRYRTWVFERTRGTIIHLVRGYGITGPSFLLMPKSFYIQLMSVQLRLLSVCWANGPNWMPPDQGKQTCTRQKLFKEKSSLSA